MTDSQIKNLIRLKISTLEAKIKKLSPRDLPPNISVWNYKAQLEVLKEVSNAI